MKVSAAARAEAAFWLTGLHGPERTASFDRGFKRWLNESADHKAAFELLTETWELSGRLPAGSFPKPNPRQVTGQRQGVLRVGLAVCAVVIVAVLGAGLYLRDPGLSTRIGEQRTLTLDDGSRIALNTDTRVIVKYDAHTRRVELKKGEALFEVAKQTGRPFMVAVDGTEITALGTSFVVRQDMQKIAVTLVEGKVRVTPSLSRKPVTLASGERLTVAKRATPAVDRPSLKRITAWRAGLVDLDDTPLIQAVDEMNRYSVKRLEVASREAAQLPVSGLFRAGDSLNFAKAIAATYRLHLTENASEIRLSGEPVLPIPVLPDTGR